MADGNDAAAQGAAAPAQLVPVPVPAQLAFSTEVNLSQPLSWFGSGSSSELTPQQFLHEIDQRRIRCGWTDEQTLAFVGVSLKGAALNWFRSTPRLAESTADRECFAGRGEGAWSRFQGLFLRSHLSGGKTHRIDQRRTFVQDQNEPIVGFRSRSLESYSTFRDEQQPNLARATTIQLNLDHFLDGAIFSERLEREHFGHAEPGGEIAECADAEQDVVTRIIITTEIKDRLRPRLVEMLQKLSNDMMAATNSYLIREFSKYLLVDGIYHNDTRKYAMDLIQKGQDDIVLFWDFVHKYNETHHQTKHSPSSQPKQSKDGGFCPSTGAAHGLDGGSADTLQKGKLPHTPGAVCGYCGKKNHVESQCQKKKNKEQREREGKTSKKERKQRGKAAAVAADETDQQQQQQQQMIQQPHQQPLMPYYPPPQQMQQMHQAAALHHAGPPPPQQQRAQMQHVYVQPPPAHPGLGQGQASSINASFPATNSSLPNTLNETLNANAWC